MAVNKHLETDELNTLIDTIKLKSSSVDFGAIPTISMNGIMLNANNNPSYTIGTGTGLGHANVMWTTTTSPYQNTVIGGGNPGMAVNQGGKISVQGKDADIDINGKSLVKWMEAMEERMNWMQPNMELEKEWDDLKKLGDRYRKLEAKCKQKAEVWKKLKSMPRPDIT